MTLVELLRLLPMSKFHNQNLYLMMSHHELKYDVTDEISCLTSKVKKSDFWILFTKMKAGDIPFTVTNFFNDFNLN